jgi:predicted membrane protein
MYYLGFVGELGFAISLPIVLCALLGKYLDDSWKMYPKMTLSLLVVGIVISMINFIEIIKTIIKNSKN